MGILANTKQYITKKVIGAAQSVGDSVATMSALSPQQLQNMADKRDTFLKTMSDMAGVGAQANIQKNMGAIGVEVYQAYLDQLENVYYPVDSQLDTFDEVNRIRFFDITKWVTDVEEQNLDKLVNVYHVLSEEDCNIALIYHRTSQECQISIGVVNTDDKNSDPAIVDKYYSRVVGAIKGNFPGAEVQGINSRHRDYGVGIPTCLKNIAGDNNDNKVKSIAIVSNVASEKSEDFISQSMEKLLDGIVPEDETHEYTIVLMAKPIKNQLGVKNRLFELYSALKPYETWQINTGINENATEGATFNLGGNIGMNVSRTNGKNAGIAVPKPAGIINAGVSQSDSIGANFGVSFQRSSNVSVTLGKNENLSQTFVNYGVKHTLDIIESQVKRMEESAALGMWEFASYIIADSPVIANNVAHMYLALTQGEKSYLSKSAVNFWDGDMDTVAAKTILSCVQKLQHPIFGLKSSVEDEWLMYPTLVTPTTQLSGKELAKALNFPRKSVSGVPVIETVAFGRDVQKYGDGSIDKISLNLGKISHMRHIEDTDVQISADTLTSHTFITGSTGTGKTTATLQLINKAKANGAKFMVVEPVKGEYKKKIGAECTVYGTNISCTDDLLKINPFWFPKNVHVLEHIDRLIEILNACWPMYAAMPAVLKDAIERAYVNQGWDLKSGEYCNKFPTFYDLLETLPEVMKDSMYSNDTKSDYAGALITRIRSLTNGLNGVIFCDREGLSEEELFEQNVIVDLSRVGAVETKSLIMGILIMKLQEFWINKDEFSDELKHLMVLEEAHNILKRTSASQTQEGANLQGKSVEMITNAIAEMRAYGEGFVIADQAPNLLDEAVIRNTNTKIVLRLPDADDRLVVGKACSLTDKQIDEIGRLPDYTAVVYQNDWIEAVLCYFEDFTDLRPYEKKETGNDFALKEVSTNMLYFNYLFDESKNIELSEDEKIDAIAWVDSLCAGIITKRMLKKAFIDGIIDRKGIAYNLFHGKTISKTLEDTYDENAGIVAATKKIRQVYAIQDDQLIQRICSYIILQICELKKEGSIVERYKDMAERGLVL